MRKRRNQPEIQSLEQRRLLSAVIIRYEYIGDIAVPAPTTGDLGIDLLTVSGTAAAGQELSVTPEIIDSGVMQYTGWIATVALSTDSVWGNGDDIVLGPIETSSSYGAGSVLIPSYVTPGNYQLLVQVAPVVVDGTAPTDTVPGDNIFDAGTIDIQPDNDSNATPIPSDDALVGASLDANAAAAGSFVDVVPQTLRTGQMQLENYNVQVVLSTDSVLGDSDDIPLVPNPSTTSGTSWADTDFNYDGVANADDWSLFNYESSAGSVDVSGGTLILNGGGNNSGGSQTGSFRSGEMQIPSTVAPGTYQVLMQVSPVNQGSNTGAVDDNPNDDFLNAGTLTVTPYVAPNIQITGATFPATAPAGGSTIDVEPTVVESGALANVDYNISVQLSTTGLWDNSAGLLSSDPGNGTNTNAPVHGGDFNISGDTTGPGTYQVLVQATPLIGPWDEYLSSITTGINATYDAGTITITPNDSANLGVTAVNIPATVAAGSSIDLEPTVVQEGVLANELYVIRPVLSTDNIFGNADDIPLKTLSIPFQSGDAQVPSITAPGTYQLLLQIGKATFGPVDTDPSDDVLDAGTITVTPDESADMAVTSIATLPKTVIQGSTIDIEPTIFSSGSLAGDDYNITVALSRNDWWGDSDDIVVAGSTSGGGDAPFHFGEVTIPADLEYGYYVLVHITPWTATPDPNNPLPTDADPTDDTFNAGLISVNPPPPDDGVTGATFPATAAAGTNIDIEPTVIQAGSLASDDYQISVSLSTDSTWGNADDIVLWPNPISTSPYHSGGMDIPSSVAPGTYQLLVHISPWSRYGPGSLPIDSNPSDDVVDAGTITVTSYNPPPIIIVNPPIGTSSPATGDLGVTSATFPASAAAGTNIDVEPTVIKTGAFSDYNITVALSTDGIWGDSGNIVLSPTPNNWINISGQSFHSGNLTLPSTLPAGEYQVLVQIGPWQSQYSVISWPFGSNSSPTDTDPGDDEVNAGTITITPYIAPDLGISGATIPATVAAGSQIDIEPTIIRTGGFTSYDYDVTAALSTDDVFGNSDDIALVQGGTTNWYGLNGDLNYDGGSLLPFHSGNLSIPANVVPGTYHLFMSVAETSNSFSGLLGQTPPVDGNTADNVFDAGTITITPYVPVSNPFPPPILTPIFPPVINPINPTGPFPTEPIVTPPWQFVPSVTAVAGEPFQYSTSGVHYSALFLSSDDQLNVSKGAPRKLLSAGATLTLGVGDTKLKSGAHQTAVAPASMAAGMYYLLGVSQGDFTIVEIATVTVYPTISGPSKVVVRPSPGGAVELEFQHLRSEIGSNVPINYYLSKDIQYSPDDAPLIMQTSTDGPAGSYSMATTGPIVAGKYYLLACTDNDGTVSLGWVSAKTIAVK